jgi:hypothetical protein
MNRLREHTGVMLMAVVVMAIAGCTTNAGWHYQPNAPQLTATHVPVTLAVEHFKDQRGTENSTYFWLCIIPLVPYCTATYQRPDTANRFLTAAAYNFRPEADLANAAALELKQDDIFHEVFVTDRPMDPAAQLILRGTIINTDWNGSMYTYLLGPYGSLPWLFGAPIGTATNTLDLQLDMLRQSDGAVLWSNTISQNYSTTEGIYYKYSTDFGYPEMFRDGMKQAVASLEQYVASQPPSFWQAMMPAAPAASSVK